MMQSFPLFLSLQGRRALVVGGTDHAARKVELLLAAGAQVSLIAKTVTGEIAQLIADARICWAGRTFDEAMQQWVTTQVAMKFCMSMVSTLGLRTSPP